MIYLESASQDPYWNLALEEYVFSRMDRREQYLILWQNDNTIVVGKYQNTAEEINQSYVDAHGIRVARRLSGGGAVYHDKGNLNYSIIVDQKELNNFNFQVFIQPVLRVLKGFSVCAEFNGRNDLTIDGRKFSGSSQYAKGGRLLHHGCIMLDSNLQSVTEALRVRSAKIQSKGIKSVASRVTTINENAPVIISMDAFKRALVQEILSGQEAKPYALSDAEKAAIQKLRDEKYATWEWNYGFYANYNLRREKRFPAGTVTVSMDVQNARIKAIRLWGDFFGNGEISELETAMTGLALDGSMKDTLEKLNISHYMSGISPENLCELLIY